MQIYQRNLPLVFARIIPYFSPFIVVVAFALYALLVRIEAAMTALLTIGIPIILASVIAIWKAPLLKSNPLAALSELRLGSPSLLHLSLLYVLSYIASLCLLVQAGPRPIAYFCLVAVMSGLLFIEILGTQQKHRRWRGLLLLQIVLLSLNLTFGQTLRLPLYYGGGDMFGHVGHIKTILDSTHVTADMFGYQYFPLFHIFGASGLLITGMEQNLGYFILFGLSFATSMLVVYLIAKKLTRDNRLPLLATLFYCLCREVIFNGMYINTRELAFVVCLLMLYLLIQENRWLKLFSIGLIFPLVLLHQTTLLHFSIILILIVITEYVLRRRVEIIRPNYILLFTVAYAGYWVWLCYPFISEWLVTANTSDTVYVPVVTEVVRDPLIVTVAKSLDYIVLLFFALLGIIGQLYQNGRGVTKTHVFALFTFITLPFFIPEIAQFLSPLFLAYRLTLVLSPFVAFAMAYGILALLSHLDFNGRPVNSLFLFTPVLVLVLIYAFSSSFILGGQTDLDLNPLERGDVRRYFTEAELASLSFQVREMSDIPVYSDSHAARYLSGTFHIRQANGTQDVLAPESIDEGYMFYRKEAFEKRGVLLFEPGVLTSIHPTMYEYRIGDPTDIQAIWANENKVYENSSVQIYVR